LKYARTPRLVRAATFALHRHQPPPLTDATRVSTQRPNHRALKAEQPPRGAGLRETTDPIQPTILADFHGSTFPRVPSWSGAHPVFSSHAHGAAHLHAGLLLPFPFAFPFPHPGPPVRRIPVPPCPAPSRRGWRLSGMAPAAVAAAASQCSRAGFAPAAWGSFGRAEEGGGDWTPVEAPRDSAPKGDNFSLPPI
jgi:hypothetical protein